MTGLVLLRPWWLLALLPAAALALWLWRRRAAGEWAAVIDPDLLAAMRRLGHLSVGGADTSPFLACAAAGLVAVALAGPATPRAATDTYERLDPIVLMLDLSPSVASGPALAELQAAAAQVLQSAGGRPVGIMVYSRGRLYRLCPDLGRREPAGHHRRALGRDHAGRRQPPGHRARGGPRHLRRATEGADPGGADFVLISDGGGADRARDEARRFADEGARVSTLALAPRTPGGPAPDPEALAELAQLGGGATAPARTPRPVLERIEAARISRIARSDEAELVFRDLGPWLLGLAGLPALALFRRRL